MQERPKMESRPRLLAGLTLGLAVLAAAAGLAWTQGLLTPAARTKSSAAPPTQSSAAEPTTAPDPLVPGRSSRLVSTSAPPANWATAQPADEFQYSRPAAEREGIEPCRARAPRATATPLAGGLLFTPFPDPLRADGSFDLIVHLHGEAPVQRELEESGQRFVLYTLTLPPGKSYAPLFAGTRLLTQWVAAIEASLTERLGKPARAQHVALSAWSAGFEGVRSILYQPEAERVEAVMLIDGLHAGRGKNNMTTQLEPFVALARRAQAGARWLTITHSSIRTTEYASTTESAHHILNALGTQPLRVQRKDGVGLDLIEQFDAGNLHVRGYAGNDKADHCAQLFLLRTLFTALNRHFTH